MRMTSEASREHPRAHADAAPEPRFIYAVGALDRSIRRKLVTILEPFHLTIADYTALSLIQRRTGYSNAQLARRAFVSPQAMNQVLQSLDARKLIERKPSDSHGSVLNVFLTPAGRETLDLCDAAVDTLEKTMLERIPADLRAQSTALMLELAKHIGRSD